MRLAEAKDLVLRLIMAGQSDAAWSLLISPASPDIDPGKFLIDGKVARAIHRFSGWHVPINPGMVQRRLRPAGHQWDRLLVAPLGAGAGLTRRRVQFQNPS